MTEIRYKKLQEVLKNEHEILLQDLHRVYADYLNSKAALLYRNLEFYDSIIYTILENNQDPIRLKFYVRDIVELLKETEDTAYVKIESIFQHQANNNQYYIFFWFSWFQTTNKLDPILKYLFYDI
ncbi:4995_t:CDS:2 [Racocetra persica]|uniref:4995_t:CDS:1 n=1 Tax=Racocetra persica TaxID=160502 RepID=A0ACA9MUB4_9GLOM|nr:4995_t:CDS:2 [Racocetra persica]